MGTDDPSPLRPCPLAGQLWAEGRLQAGHTLVLLARPTGMCRGVSRALSMVERLLEQPIRGRVFLLGPIIHNPAVERWMEGHGVKILGDVPGNVGPGDTVVIPAFGSPLPQEVRVRRSGARVVDTTCPSVRQVWRHVQTYARGGFTTILHGRPDHPETRATVSRVEAWGGAFVVVQNLAQARLLAHAMASGQEPDLRGWGITLFSPGFDPQRDLHKVGMANQTTMLSSESLAMARLFRDAMLRRWGSLEGRFLSFSTICHATQLRQEAVVRLVEHRVDLMVVVGGFASSNTGHLAELASQRVPTVHVEGAQGLRELSCVVHKPPGQAPTCADLSWLAAVVPRTVGFAAGASTPDAELGETVARLLTLLGEPLPPRVG